MSPQASDIKEPGLHPLADKNEDSGHAKRPDLVKAPTVTTHGVSEDQYAKKKAKTQTFSDVVLLDDPNELKDEYELFGLNVGQAMYIGADENNSTDALFEKLNKECYRIRQKYGIVECDENGDVISDQVCIHERKKNADGTFQIDAAGKIITGANQALMPRMVYTRNYVVKSVVKDNEFSKGSKAPGDGVVVLRVT